MLSRAGIRTWMVWHIFQRLCDPILSRNPLRLLSLWRTRLFTVIDSKLPNCKLPNCKWKPFNMFNEYICTTCFAFFSWLGIAKRKVKRCGFSWAISWHHCWVDAARRRSTPTLMRPPPLPQFLFFVFWLDFWGKGFNESPCKKCVRQAETDLSKPLAFH